MNSIFGNVFFGLASAAVWGMGDFFGGLAGRKLPSKLVVLFSQLAGIVAVALLAVLWREGLLSWRDVALSAIAGCIGSVGLLLLYRILAAGDVSIASPLSGVVACALPVLFGVLTQGLPKPVVLIGFALALLGVWFVSRPSSTNPVVPAKLVLPVLCGACFGGFFILISQLHSGYVFVPLLVARVASIGLLFVLLLAQKQLAVPPKAALPQLIACGVLDALGNSFFVLSKQLGRLDVASALSSLYPASTVILAFIILKERLNRGQAVGVALVLAAIPLIAA